MKKIWWKKYVDFDRWLYKTLIFEVEKNLYNWKALFFFLICYCKVFIYRGASHKRTIIFLGHMVSIFFLLRHTVCCLGILVRIVGSILVHHLLLIHVHRMGMYSEYAPVCLWYSIVFFGFSSQQSFIMLPYITICIYWQYCLFVRLSLIFHGLSVLIGCRLMVLFSLTRILIGFVLFGMC